MSPSLSDWKELFGSFSGAREVVIDTVNSDDLPTLMEIHGASFPRGWSDGEFHKLLSDENYSCFVARRAGEASKPPMGFVLLRQILDEAEVITIATSPTKRKRGVGRQLMEEAIRRLQRERASKLFLEVDESNVPALKLYERLGFKQIGDRKGYYQDIRGEAGKTATALVMQRELG